MQNHQDHVKKALIIGNGIAGPALALFLKRAGIEAEIYEARETPEGYALSLSCNGVAVLAELGLDHAAFAEGSAVTKWQMQNGKGRHLGAGVLASGDFKSVFIKLFANPKASGWMYSYRIDWDTKVEVAVPDTGSRHETVNAACT